MTLPDPARTAQPAIPHTPALPALRYVALPAFSDNYIWLIDDGRNALVVDPGQAAPVFEALEREGLRLAAILLTHHHADHVGGVGEIVARYGSLPVYGPAHESIAEVTVPLAGGSRIEITAPTASFDVIDVPGHTRGHIAYYQAPSDSAGLPHLFCGDTLFANGCGRLFEGTPAQMLASLDALAALPGETQVHCAHEYTLSNLRFAVAVEPGNAELQDWRRRALALREAGVPTLPTTLAQERATNPFLRVDAAEVRASVAAQVGHEAPSRLAVFTALRAWKDHF